jgi:polar amino acid transport system substrate-binding protein
MLSLRSLTAGAVALFALSVTASAKDWTSTTIRIGTDATYAPFESQDSGGKIVGFDIDVGNAVCAELKLKCEFTNQDWDGIIPALNAGKIDAILSSMSITEERLKQIDFTDKVYNTPPVIVVPKDSAIAGFTAKDLAGKTIGVQSSTTHATYAEKTYPDSEIKYYKTADERNLDLAAGRLDAAIDDIVIFQQWLGTPDGACCKIAANIKIVPEIHGRGAGIGVRKEDTDLRDLFNKGLAAIRANGKYKEINDKYFNFDAYGD